MKSTMLTAAVLLCSATTSFSQAPARAVGAAGLSAADRAFAVKAAQGGMAEVDLGNLAMEKSANADAKQFGQRMVADHGKAGDELKMIAQTKGITLPSDLSPKAKALHARLAKLSGDAFDRNYMQAMLADHRQAAADFRHESTAGRDSDLKAFAAKTLPTIEDHLKMAMGANKTGVGTSGARRRGKK